MKSMHGYHIHPSAFPKIDNLMAHWRISVGFLCILHWLSRHEHPWRGEPLPPKDTLIT